ncbi:molecular chaperone DnaJ [Belliella sp. DSM 107340]|uniref:Molecular chaperone DnaJ n=1 Tax=Belliella calami TaxID=2923436 RepID=A0ABS9URJ0_9BACT|nr:molecular chaperone DnaJ [Belliella calami]MCH7399227.1 molecular chaperone DnaJ [Belliella calami]
MILNPIQFSQKLIFLISLMFCFNSANAQVQPSLGGSSRLMNNAMKEMENGNYEKANIFFRQIIDSNLPIPPEMPYYFAETLYELKQYDNSANFLNKYLELNGFKGDNYERAKALEELLNIPLNAIKACELCDRRGYRFQECFTCEGSKHLEQDCGYCKAKGIVGCSKCVGSGLITKRNVFNIIEYFECERCSGQGRLTCPTCEGSKLETSACRTCQGSGRLQSDKVCDHKDENPRHLSFLFNRMKSHH